MAMGSIKKVGTTYEVMLKVKITHLAMMIACSTHLARVMMGCRQTMTSKRKYKYEYDEQKLFQFGNLARKSRLFLETIWESDQELVVIELAEKMKKKTY